MGEQNYQICSKVTSSRERRTTSTSYYTITNCLEGAELLKGEVWPHLLPFLKLLSNNGPLYGELLLAYHRLP